MDSPSVYGLIGYPLGHSFSAIIFNGHFASQNIDASYHLFPIQDISELPKLIKRIPNLKGLNVTSPYKEQVFKFLDTVSDVAEAAKAVNVIDIERCENGNILLHGHNTDLFGFETVLKHSLRPGLASALILGTGGAARTVEIALARADIKSTFASRNPKGDNQLAYADITKEVVDKYDVIVNCTPLGNTSTPDKAPSIPYEAISRKHICLDLCYNPLESKFLRLCRLQGAVTHNGLEMLIEQAAKAAKIWKI